MGWVGFYKEGRLVLLSLRSEAEQTSLQRAIHDGIQWKKGLKLKLFSRWRSCWICWRWSSWARPTATATSRAQKTMVIDNRWKNKTRNQSSRRCANPLTHWPTSLHWRNKAIDNLDFYFSTCFWFYCRSIKTLERSWHWGDTPTRCHLVRLKTGVSRGTWLGHTEPLTVEMETSDFLEGPNNSVLSSPQKLACSSVLGLSRPTVSVVSHNGPTGSWGIGLLA